MNKIVSIRCRRHKKRFNVESDWLLTCEWLCPKCYGKLKPNERARYAPCKGEKPEIRGAEAGKPTILPDIYGDANDNRTKKTVSVAEKLSKMRPVNRCIPKKCSERNDPSGLISDFLDRRNNRRNCYSSPVQTTRFESFSPSPVQNTRTKLSELLPRSKIHCLKCGEDVPCHGFWLEKSRVLCPGCASEMSGDEFLSFNRLHSPTDLVMRNERYEIQKRMEELEDRSNKNIPTGESDIVSFGGGCSELFIRKATELELQEAMKRGRLSKVRYRIEMKRRANPERYDWCHEDEERSFGKL